MTLVLVTGALANKHRNGGGQWVRLSWVLGLRKLGFDVHFVEQLDAAACVDAAGRPTDFSHSANLASFQNLASRFAMEGSATLLCGAETWGASMPDLECVAEEADLFVNISSRFDLEPLLRRLRRKVYVDLDPGFTQFWLASATGGFRLDGYDVLFTVGENIGRPGCSLPTAGLRWRPARQPVVLEHWPVVGVDRPDRFTTVASWRGPYGPISINGSTLGLKVHEFRKFALLPEHAAPATFEIALDIHPADAKDRTLLERHGWRLTDPQVVSTADGFRRYVQRSSAEFSVAQGIYVQTGSGWFSDRTVRYLACGKPALVQDTGFTRNLPVGEGLVAFSTPEQAAAGAREIVDDYDRHSSAARRLAEEYFDSDRVLGRVVEEAGI